MLLWSRGGDLVLTVHNLTQGDHKALSYLVFLRFRGCIGEICCVSEQAVTHKDNRLDNFLL